MDFTRQRCKPVEKIPKIDKTEFQYPDKVIFYTKPPTEDITIQEFEGLALERIKVLRIFDRAISENKTALSNDWKEYVNTELEREDLKGYLRPLNGTTITTNQELDLRSRRRDYLSHFILRLVCCPSLELQNWFLSREVDLFRYKFLNLTREDVKYLLKISKLEYTLITEEQKTKFEDELYDIKLYDFFKLPFTQVTELVRFRRCFLKEGYAYVNTNDLMSVIVEMLQIEIEYGLRLAKQFIQDTDADERLVYLVKTLRASGKDLILAKDTDVSIESIDQLYTKSFPLCMRACHEHLRANHHHMYFGRLQYGLFLKGIGVTMEDSLRFWREEFMKKMDEDKFIKKRYEYGIMYNYGKVGSCLSSPFSCLKIISESETLGPNQMHGCPFKVWDQKTLKMKLLSYGLAAIDIEMISNYASKGNYQLACGKYFQITHNSEVEPSINHPNQYFNVSQTLMRSANDQSQQENY